MATRKAYGPLVSKPSANVDTETSNFIRYYCKKWKAKTLFQVLLQYRAARFQDLFNLSQQIHLFNQSVVNDLQRMNHEVDFDCIDARAQVNGWLGRRKPSVLKMPFKLEDIPFFDTVYLCDPSQRQPGPKDIDEPWDAPLRWKNNVSSQIVSSGYNYTDRLDCIDENQRIRKPSVDKIIFIPYNRNPDEPIRRLSTFQPDHDYPMHFGEYQANNNFNQKHNRSLYPPDDHRYSYNHAPIKQSYSRNSGYRDYNNQQQQQQQQRYMHTSYNSSDNSSSMANNLSRDYGNNNFNDHNNKITTKPTAKPLKNDDEYAKSSAKSYQTPKSSHSYIDSNPIDELQTKFRRSESTEEDDPPFNFRAMLRKTNYNVDVSNSREENIKRYSFKNRDNRKFASVDESQSYSSPSGSLRKHNSADQMNTISTEVAPGVVVEGYVADL